MTEAAKPKAVKFATIAEAMVAFQKDIPVPKKDSSADTGKYSYDYASLDKLTPLIFSALSAVGIAYIAAPTVRESDGVFGLEAKLLHESGQDLKAFYPLGSPNSPAQAVGSAVTYARRYTLLSLTGVAPTGEDDDGAKASEAQAKADAPVAKKQSTAEELRAELGAMITANPLVTGDDANNILNEITGGAPPAKWTAADLKKAKTAVTALIAERTA